ncbi:MAG: HD domain-containing protein [Cyanobacteria bacterium]|nr:HD domain-containing protein [Cyanobacteriota bacterium]
MLAYRSLLLPPSEARPPIAFENLPLVRAALLSEDESKLRQIAKDGVLLSCLPEWGRMSSEFNTQHRFHEFPLDEHTLRVVERTKRSEYFVQLNDDERWSVVCAALLHDVAKITGLPEEREALSPDRTHPHNSALLSRDILAQWGESRLFVERVAILIEHHQLFGVMLMTTDEKALPSEEAVCHAARMIKTPSMLKMLSALSEGDIRGVKDNDAIFTPEVAQRMALYIQAVESKLQVEVPNDQSEHQYWLPIPMIQKLLHLWQPAETRFHPILVPLCLENLSVSVNSADYAPVFVLPEHLFFQASQVKAAYPEATFMPSLPTPSSDETHALWGLQPALFHSIYN